MNDKPQTPEEARWMASVLDPEKARRRMKYGYMAVAVWSLFAAGWVIWLTRRDETFDWSDGISALVLLMGLTSGFVGIVNNRRIAKGRKPM